MPRPRIDLSELSERSLVALDYPELLTRLAAECASDSGVRALEHLAPATTLTAAQLRMKRTASAIEISEEGTDLPRARFADIRDVLGRLTRGATASGAEIYDIHGVLAQARRLREYVKPHQTAHPELAELLASDAALDRVAQQIDTCLEPSGEVSDRASSALSEAREKVRETERELRALLKRLVANHASLLSGEYFAEREGRYVLPVRSDAHQRLEGSVIGSSASGNTLFVEPRQVAALVNRLRVRQAAVEREVARILSGLLALIEPRTAAVLQAFQACVDADVLAALSRWARQSGSVALEVRASPSLELLAARHPLLARSTEVVANDLVLRSGQALVISGPNAGGKTVALKTLGLFALMARAGIPVPCDPQSTLGYFESVLADVGDEQSLSHSLSTFSGHVQKLASILDVAGDGTLVILDEVAAGTDPEEGAALAGSVLEALVQAGAAVAVTTHYERLKEQAAAAGPLVNACVGFDFANMAPTFKVTLGIFGPSSALVVAGRYGLAPEVIERARQLLPREAIERERVARELSDERQRLDRQLTEVTAERTRLELYARRLEAERQALIAEGKRELQRESARLLADVKSARAELQQARSRLKAEAKDSKGLRGVERDISKVAAQVAIGGKLAPETRQPASVDSGTAWDAAAVTVGDSVRIITTGVVGTVLAPPSRGAVQVRVGAIRLTVPFSELGPAAGVPKARQPSRTLRQPLPPRGEPDRARRTSDNTLDLRGTRVGDAPDCVDAFVDRLLSEGQDVGFVLHGHGTGALRVAVRDHLAGSVWVAHVEPADKDEGGDAFTMFRIASR